MPGRVRSRERYVKSVRSRAECAHQTPTSQRQLALPGADSQQAPHPATSLSAQALPRLSVTTVPFRHPPATPPTPPSSPSPALSAATASTGHRILASTSAAE
eukprot:CAMPEP_0182597486 /NCGR_PEP_ID=MMETSP1324-20130603/86341_1 /TAXON_ID=236786 /ORGANISM="Florenciella sp., Strain RCC1587" /LENGTH=101 /DNA_ID=CAMNT_0024815237 /DNA_START=124 /DNA_END=429 /DNA_ORIENTATION=+